MKNFFMLLVFSLTCRSAQSLTNLNCKYVGNLTSVDSMKLNFSADESMVAVTFLRPTGQLDMKGILNCTNHEGHMYVCEGNMKYLALANSQRIQIVVQNGVFQMGYGGVLASTAPYFCSTSGPF